MRESDPQLKSATKPLEKEFESRVRESPNCRSTNMFTSTPGETLLSQIDHTTQSVIVTGGEDTTTSECTKLNRAGFLEDMELETEDTTEHMVRSNVS